MTLGGDLIRLGNVQMAATQVKCCEAARVAFPQPCPWHARSDEQYELVTEEGQWPY